jgi:hypothetical protein
MCKQALACFAALKAAYATPVLVYVKDENTSPATLVVQDSASSNSPITNSLDPVPLTAHQNQPLPNADITLFEQANCEINGNGKHNALNSVPANTCFHWDKFEHRFKGVWIGAVVPKGMSCQLVLYKDAFDKCDPSKGNAVFSKLGGNYCAIPPAPGAMYGAYNCQRALPTAYPPGDVSFWNGAGCPSGGSGVAKKTVKPNICTLRDSATRHAQHSAKGAIAKDTKITLPSGFKCELALYYDPKCDPITQTLAAADVCYNDEFLVRFTHYMWKCGPDGN